MAKPFVHPLFDLSSAYRLASQESVWFDHGERSIKRFFLALHRQGLREEWRDPRRKLSEEPQGDWRFSPRVNALLQEYHRRAKAVPVEEPVLEPALLARTRGGDYGGPAEEFAPPPTLLMFDLSREGTPTHSPPHRSATAFPGWFTGIGEPVYGFDRRHEHDTFSINIPEQEDGRWCLALLLPLRLIRELAGLLGRDHEWDDPEEQPVLDTIVDLLKPERLGRPAENAAPKEFEAACRLGSVMALAAGWQQKVANGRFKVNVDLGGKCPALQVGTWVVFCKGPRAEEWEALP